MYVYCNNCPNFIRGKIYYSISKANYWLRTILDTSQLTAVYTSPVESCGPQMENYQQRLVDVLIRGPPHPPLEGSIHVTPNDMDVYSGFFNPLM